MVIVIYGDERLLMRQKLDELKKRYDISDEQMNYASYSLKDTSMSEILADAATLPFFSDYKMVVVRDPLFLTKSRQKDVDENDIEAFNDYIAHENPSTIFVVYRDEMDFDNRKKSVKLLKKEAQFIQIEKIQGAKLYQATRNAIKSRGASIEDDALNALIDRTGNDLEAISHQVDKLTLYTKHITTDDINALVTPLMEERVYMLTNALLHHDLEKTMKIYHDLMIANNEPIMIIAAIANSIRQVYQVKLLVRQGYRDQEIVKALGMRANAIYPVRKNAEGFELHELTSYLHALSELDVKIKSGRIDKYKGLELFLMHMGSRL